MFLYRLLTIMLSPIITGHILWLSLKYKQSRYLLQRFGFANDHLPQHSLWFHCASVGEVYTLLPLVRNIHAENQQLSIIITTNTITGGNIVTQQKLDYLHHCYLPFDWIHCINRYLSSIKPTALYVMDTEIWPNLFSLCRSRNIDVNIINARLSSKTTSARPWIKKILKISLSKVTAIHARTENDAESYKSLGAIESIINVTGNLKLTTVLATKNKNEKINLAGGREYVLLASTHNDEEKRIYEQWEKLNRCELLIIAPRHPQRAPSILKQLNCESIAVRSKNESITSTTEIFLLDTVGELTRYFTNAKIVIMGGSFVTIGGHNVMEPASDNCAIITGPYMENFAEELELMAEKDAIIQVKSYDELGECLNKLIDDERLRSVLQNNTRELVHNAGAVLDSYRRLILH